MKSEGEENHSWAGNYLMKSNTKTFRLIVDLSNRAATQRALIGQQLLTVWSLANQTSSCCCSAGGTWVEPLIFCKMCTFVSHNHLWIKHRKKNRFFGGSDIWTNFLPGWQTVCRCRRNRLSQVCYLSHHGVSAASADDKAERTEKTRGQPTCPTWTPEHLLRKSLLKTNSWSEIIICWDEPAAVRRNHSKTLTAALLTIFSSFLQSRSTWRPSF